ncbi:MAG TPA: alpha amylase C-terminal domain-containing protein, partial [Candidatus Acidoferrum sp.]|nr:alpha amylase C-terminal domain-containing protein [Candidatus Acidoferrum sp.]
DLNRHYRDLPALHRLDTRADGFAWIDADDHLHSLFSFWRRADNGAPPVLCLFNFTPMDHQQFRIGVPEPGWYAEVLNTDAVQYNGGGQGNLGGVQAEPVPSHGQPWSLSITLPPLSALLFCRS